MEDEPRQLNSLHRRGRKRTVDNDVMHKTDSSTESGRGGKSIVVNGVWVAL